MKKEIIEKIIDKLYDYEDLTEYSCDLAYTLFEGENMDGSMTYSTHEAMEWIKNNFEDIAEVYEEIKFQFGSEFIADFNLFENPEKFMVLIYLESASHLLSRCKTIDDNWNEQITLDKKTIEKLKKELDQLDNGLGIYE